MLKSSRRVAMYNTLSFQLAINPDNYRKQFIYFTLLAKINERFI